MNNNKSTSTGDAIFTLPDLPYAFDALEPNFDKETMQIHHDKHHATYVAKLNAAIKGHKLAAESLESIFDKITVKDEPLRNHGGGHYNHSLFWEVMTPGGSSKPKSAIGDAIDKQFQSFENFKALFTEKAVTVFGSGWAWLSVDSSGKLFISGTSNQDNPLMKNILDEAGTPILCIDVWEHAYYLKFQNKRPEYVNSFIEIINWDIISKKFEDSL